MAWISTGMISSSVGQLPLRQVVTRFILHTNDLSIVELKNKKIVKDPNQRSCEMKEPFRGCRYCLQQNAMQSDILI